MTGQRFTAWLTRDERLALRKLAREHGCSMNWLVRLAVRNLLYDAPIPDYIKKEKVTR